ncbi:hypothetical protein [uncultured Mediterranean phage uvMED]|nr:hypothetical protein [uncultured Mediterranean phage uvMED]|tara:strand:- start:513 stop:653 length:141 start_codon:yes stop_codon:yes gene_type:complete
MTDKELLAYIYGIVSTNKYGSNYSPIYDVLEKHFKQEQEENGPSTT